MKTRSAELIPDFHDLETVSTINWLRGVGFKDAANALAELHVEDRALRVCLQAVAARYTSIGHSRRDGTSDHQPRVDRFEVIDETGRLLTRRPVHVELSYQDDGRTLKVFLTQLRATGEGARDEPKVETVSNGDVPDHAGADGVLRVGNAGRERDGLDRGTGLPTPDALLLAVSLDPHRLTRYDLVQVNACYTTDHEMEASDDGEWVRFEDVEAELARLRGERQEPK
jgi:hypothetical protein